MRRPIATAQEIRVKGKFKMVDIFDIFYVFASIPVAMILGFFVYQPIRFLFWLFLPVFVFYMILPNRDIYNKKNYEAYVLILSKDKIVYHAI